MDTTYPKFFRKDGRCLKQENETTGVEIIVPRDGEFLPLIHSRVTFPTPERMSAELAAMSPVEPREWDAFLHTFYEVADRNEDIWRSNRERRIREKQMTPTE